MKEHLKDIERATDILHLTCTTIQKFDGCGSCPLAKSNLCLEETDVLTLFERSTNKLWTEFFEHGDYVQTLEFCFEDYDGAEESMWGNDEEERIRDELLEEEYYKRLPRKEINVYGHNITIIG